MMKGRSRGRLKKYGTEKNEERESIRRKHTKKYDPPHKKDFKGENIDSFHENVDLDDNDYNGYLFLCTPKSVTIFSTLLMRSP